MLLAALQDWVDRQLAVPPERWLLRVAAAAAVFVTAIAVEGGFGGGVPWFVAIVGVIGVASAVGPDSHMGSLVVLIVVWRWLAVVDDPLSWRLVVVAVGLHVHHTALAMLAAVPETASIPSSVLTRWGARSGVAVAAAIAVWLLVIALDGRSFGGSAVLTAASLAIVAAGGVALIAAVLDRGPGEPESNSVAGRSGGRRGRPLS